ncbi:YcaO-like family protein [Allokutzneria sp. NRRL B-24872]|uniref:YcaO-like family protein n=1 Tax=Allokutzneria sp. NRRL B-24872 TaxID=1137961 RepID=UPI00143DBE1E|nr:YcaO-like family protein [Allokutzneria sp. NRRL B-24872]
MNGPEGRAGGVTGPLRSSTTTTGPAHHSPQRTRTPEQTLDWLSPALRTVGITRLADLTWLDEIGIPVYQAVRPNAWLVSVSQGTGPTKAAAKVRAAVEAIELWHAEHVEPDLPEAEAGAAAPGLGYRMRDLDSSPRSCLNPALRLSWNRARWLDGSGETQVPTACLRLDGRVRPEWAPPAFAGSTNGLAGGDTLDEAIGRGLTEVVERDAVARHQHGGVRPPRLRLATVDGAAAGLLARFADAEVEVVVELLDGPCGIPCFGARIFSETFPVYSRGHGCHLDPQIALCRALTEAARSRVTSIAGTRDDIGKPSYQQTSPFAVLRDREVSVSGAERDFGTVAAFPVHSPAEDNALLVERITTATGVCPLVVDLTRPELAVPVARVIAPRLLSPHHL